MTRKKVKLTFITNDSARKATFKKRKKGFMKKMHELSTLCGIDACAVIYSPYEAQPDVWPNNLGVRHLLSMFKRMPEMEKIKKMVNHESFLRQRIIKINELLKKQMKENRDKEMTEVMYQCLTGKGSIANLMLPDLIDLGHLVDQTLIDISKRIDSLKKPISGKVLPLPTPPPPLPPHTNVSCMSSSTILDGMQRTQWFNNEPSEHNLGLGAGYEMTQCADDNPNPIWPNQF